MTKDKEHMLTLLDIYYYSVERAVLWEFSTALLEHPQRKENLDYYKSRVKETKEKIDKLLN